MLLQLGLTVWACKPSMDGLLGLGLKEVDLGAARCIT